MEIVKTDDFGNTLAIDGQEILLTLKRVRRKPFSLGMVRGGFWWVTRDPSWIAKGKGHWFNNLKCWMLNYYTLRLNRPFGFSRVDFVGYDGQDHRHHIIRSVDDCLKERKIQFRKQGFELQVIFRPQFGARPEPLSSHRTPPTPRGGPVQGSLFG